jgi:uncharacterized protein (TIGR02246 family)
MDAARLADELAIRDLVARYAHAVGTGDASDWAETWADDGEWNVMGRSVQGRDAVVQLWKDLMAGLAFVVQRPSAPSIRIDGPTGTGRWSVVEHAKTLDGTALFTIGVYTDTYVKTGDEWRFQSRHFHMLYSGPPDLSGPTFPAPQEDRS